MGLLAFSRRSLGLHSPPPRPSPVCCSPDGPHRLVAYLTEGSQGWILDFLWRDISASGVWGEKDSPELCVASDRDSLAAVMEGANAFVLVMFQGHLNQLLRDGIPAERVILYLSHVRIGLALPDLNQLHAVLALNAQEQALLMIQGMDSRLLQRFRAGFDPNLFFPGPPLNQRAIDVLVVGRYVGSYNNNYHRRKRFSFLCDLLAILVDKDIQVALIGPGWDSCEYPLPSAVQQIDCSHPAYGAVYRSSRLVISVAAQEGGPVSFLEGLASGCLMLSVPTGFAAEFQSGENGIWHLPITANAQKWCEQIQFCLKAASENELIVGGSLSPAREAFLGEASFDHLAQQLRQISSQPALNSRKESLGG